MAGAVLSTSLGNSPGNISKGEETGLSPSKLGRAMKRRKERSLRHGDGGDAARLRDGDFAPLRDHARLEEVLRHLRALPRPGLAHDDHHLKPRV